MAVIVRCAQTFGHLIWYKLIVGTLVCRFLKVLKIFLFSQFSSMKLFKMRFHLCRAGLTDRRGPCVFLSLQITETENMMDKIVSGLSESSIKVRLAAVRYFASPFTQL